jgi:hypothetical protein
MEVGETVGNSLPPTALPGSEPEVFAFKERDVANYTTGH